MYTGFLGEYIYYSLWFFLIYSFYGVIIEMIFCYAREYKGVIESRCGLLYLPLSPIYGLGGVVVSLVLLPHLANPILIFVLSALLCTALEYVASLVMEKMFRSVFWDYSNKPLNVHGRICLEFAIYWGCLGVVLVYLLDTVTYIKVESWPRSTAEIILNVCLVITFCSVVLTLLALRRFDQKTRDLKAQRTGSPRVDLDTPVGRLVDRLVPDVVMINTFPRMSSIVEYSMLSGKSRKLIKLDLHLGRPSELHQQLRRNTDLVSTS